MLYWLGLIISGYATENVHDVLPDDNTCERHPCLYLSYLIDNHQYYFTSNTKIVFSADFHHLFKNMIIQNVSNFSLVSTSKGMIICSPQTFIGFYNVVNLTITNLYFGNVVILSIILMMILTNLIGQTYSSRNAPMYKLVMYAFMIQ